MNRAFTNLEDFLSELSDDTKKAYFGFSKDGVELERFLINSHVNKQITNYLLSRNIKVKGKKVLEFGCRDGSSFMSYLNLGASEVVGVDIDKEAMNLSEKIYSDLGYTNISYRQSFINEKLPIKYEEFDIISCNAVLEHIHPSLRTKYIIELQNAVKPGGYLIVSDTPNKLWIREGHTTGLFFINFIPFKWKCYFASQTKRWKNVISYNNYDEWIFQGIEGVTYSTIHHLFDKTWTSKQDIEHNWEYTSYIFGQPVKNPIIFVYKSILFIYAFLIDLTYLKIKRFPSLAICPSLCFSFRKTSKKL